MGNWITADNVKAKLFAIPLTDLAGLDDQITNEFIPQAQAMANEFVGHALSTTTVTRHFDGNGGLNLDLKVRPVQNISLCEIYAVPFSSLFMSFKRLSKANTVDFYGNKITDEIPPIVQTDMLLDCAAGVLTIPLTNITMSIVVLPITYPQFILGTDNIRVTMTYGYPEEAMPRQVKDAVAMVAACMVLAAKGQKFSGGLYSSRIGEMSRQYANGQGKEAVQYGGMIARMEEAAQRLLEPFKSIMG